MNNVLIHNKEQFLRSARDFLNTIFVSVLAGELGEIEIRTFIPVSQYFFSSEQEAAEKAYDLCNKGIVLLR